VGPPDMEPLHTLGAAGSALWGRIWAANDGTLLNIDAHIVQMLCECVDERQLLRSRVFVEGEWRDRVALRTLDAEIEKMLTMLGLNPLGVIVSAVGFGRLRRVCSTNCGPVVVGSSRGFSESEGLPISKPPTVGGMRVRMRVLKKGPVVLVGCQSLDRPQNRGAARSRSTSAARVSARSRSRSVSARCRSVSVRSRRVSARRSLTCAARASRCAAMASRVAACSCRMRSTTAARSPGGSGLGVRTATV
jgi:hypothetical protein